MSGLFNLYSQLLHIAKQQFASKEVKPPHTSVMALMKSRLNSCLTNALVLGWKAQLVKYFKLDCATVLTA